MIEKVGILNKPQTNIQFYPRLTLDFHTNKKICDEVAVIPSKRLRNKIAGFTTHLMRR
jgi:small subunit ribosomal protein S17e